MSELSDAARVAACAASELWNEWRLTKATWKGGRVVVKGGVALGKEVDARGG